MYSFGILGCLYVHITDVMIDEHGLLEIYLDGERVTENIKMSPGCYLRTGAALTTPSARKYCQMNASRFVRPSVSFHHLVHQSML